ncbi:MAG: hypothetical protein V3W41_10345 [Planctomycetota bacterium]
MRAFVLLSVVFGVLVTSLLWFVAVSSFGWLTATEAGIAALAAWLMSTTGVGVLIAGTLAKPEGLVGFLVAGMLAKMLVFAIALALMFGLASEELRPDVTAIATLAAFLLLGGVQYGYALRVLGRKANFK